MIFGMHRNVSRMKWKKKQRLRFCSKCCSFANERIDESRSIQSHKHFECSLTFCLQIESRFYQLSDCCDTEKRCCEKNGKTHKEWNEVNVYRRFVDTHNNNIVKYCGKHCVSIFISCSLFSSSFFSHWSWQAHIHIE